MAETIARRGGASRGDRPKEGTSARAPAGRPTDSAPSGGAGTVATEEVGVFRVKAETSAKALSGAIAAQARTGLEPLKVQAIGPASVNQGLKAIIIARGNVADDGFDFVYYKFAVRPETVPDVGRDALFIHLNKAARQVVAAPAESNILRVNGTSKVGALAGAIAGKAREGATLLSATGIGPNAVLKIVKAVALARSYAKEAKLDIFAVPHFVVLKLGEEERTGVCLDIFVQPLAETA